MRRDLLTRPDPPSGEPRLSQQKRGYGHDDRSTDRGTACGAGGHFRCWRKGPDQGGAGDAANRERKARSEEHTSELESLMRTSYAVFCWNNNRLYTTLKNK